MSELFVEGLAKSFGVTELFREVSFRVTKGERAGLVGANGAGKTTLMRCILGEEEADRGLVKLDAGDSVGYVEQQASLGDGTLHEEFRRAFSDILKLGEKKAALEREIGHGDADEALLEEYGRVAERFERLEGYDVESRIRRVAFGLGFTDEDLESGVAHLSGGQKTRVCLAKALLREPDFLFLDEPTNHLDIRMIEWLEEFLRSYRGGVLLISHDRFFLDRVATKIIGLEHGTATVYAGNYGYYRKVRAQRRAALEAAYEKQQEKIRETEEYIRRFRAGIKAKQARGRQSQLDRMERIVLPPEKARFNYFAFHPPSECAERVAEVEDAAAVFDGHEVFSHVSLLVRRGDGVAVVGANGEGKTTLLRLIVGELEPAQGQVKLGSRVKLGYFSQQHEGLHKERTALEEILYEYGMDEETARGVLGAFLFRGDEVERVIGDMSGGEQSRLAFLKLMLTGANFLVLDEPTNHLDIPAKEAVEDALMAFPGTFVVVSHDRYFLNKIANVTLEMEGGKLTRYDGGYDYYREKKAALSAQEEEPTRTVKKSEKAGEEKGRPRSSDKADKEKRIAAPNVNEEKRDELLRRAEAEIAMAEAELKMLEHEMNDPTLQQDPEASRRIAGEYAAKEAEIERRYEKWSALAE